MTIHATIAEASRDFGRFCDAAGRGETVIITRADGEDVALISASELPGLDLRDFAKLERFVKTGLNRAAASGANEFAAGNSQNPPAPIVAAGTRRAERSRASARRFLSRATG